MRDSDGHDDHDDHSKHLDHNDYDDYYDHHNGWIETVEDAQLQEIVSFIDNTFAGDNIVDFLKLDCADGSEEDPTFSVAMPFLNSEDWEASKDSNNKIARLREIHKGVGEPEATTLLLSQTLDESLCVTSNESSPLNYDQVVRRYYDRCRTEKRTKLAAPSGSRGPETSDEIKPRILMVSPLRLWKVGRDVVITAFPSSWEESRDFDFTPLGHVYQSVMKTRPASGMQLAWEIMASLVAVMDGPTYAGLHESLLTIFEAETSVQAQEQLRLYQSFRHHLNARIIPSLGPGSRPRGAIDPSAAIEIVKEMDCFRIVMDIRDELAMISSVISGQERVMKRVTKFTMKKVTRTIAQAMALAAGLTDATKDAPEATEDQSYVITDKSSELDLGIAMWKLRISKIDKRAQMVEKVLGHLLGLKLEVSNLLETEDSKKHLKSSQDLLENNQEVLESIKTLQEGSQAIQKSSEALLGSNTELLKSIDNLQKSSKALQDKADKQSGYLFAFTMVTVIFAPLSFVASFLAIPSHDFPQDGGVSWSQGQIGGGFGEF
ncbi:hypothetical protein NW759_001970 [Fusarium solani]|nr:hypothetical protein NW759_001970 [Fusarium solani]